MFGQELSQTEYSPQERFAHSVKSFQEFVEECGGSVDFNLNDNKVRLADYLHKTKGDRYTLFTERDDDGQFVRLIDKSGFAHNYFEQDVEKGFITAEGRRQ